MKLKGSTDRHNVLMINTYPELLNFKPGEIHLVNSKVIRGSVSTREN